MLDQETKRKIDNARDILVGKVPDPKSQVEQITIALIYKFMDDMDKESVEWGGKATFFSGEYEKYAWSKIFDPRLGGFEIIDLYGNAIIRMNQNPHVPLLFRDIFKNAYLPYRDPETLKSFLKEINEFTYDHSERLGDAFEYLLSVMDSQGDAGQFRTPRHIIDFIVRIVDPKKNETVLDPACGTAGFLISSYKHILKANAQDRPGDQLTSDEKKRLINNFMGYDISPDMVRLSLVNLYLHGFSDPKIDEYDTLTNEERWNETSDVVLANPPFMTPKGGTRPHKRFSIQAKRSEVLFVDYIAEHLNPNGRAGVIVPEGIIFQAQNAYKNLRKMLIENYLWAVVSLPAGVFNPYSGVKTSILVMDKTLSKKTDKILFVKIENDGFDLGAQRRPIDQNDLPKALDFIKDYHQAMLSSRDVDDTDFAHVVEKAKIAKSGDWNLSGERYREVYELRATSYELVDFEETIDEVKYTNKIKKADFFSTGKYPIIDQSEAFIAGYWDKEEDVFRIKKPVTIFGDHTRVIKYVDFDFVLGADGVKILEPNERFDPKFYYYLLKEIEIQDLGYSRHFKELKRTRIPLPPLDVQKAIVAEIDGYQKIIDGARQVVENYKPTIKIDPDWEMVALGKVARLINGRAYKREELLDDGPTPVLRVGNFFSNRDWYYSDLELDEDKYCDVGDLLYAWSASFGPRIWEGPRVIFHYHIWKIETTEAIDKRFLFHLLEADSEKIKSEGHGIAMMHATKGGMEKREFPLPPLSVQQEIVAQIEAEQELVNGNKKLTAIYDQRIKDKIAEVWGD